MGEQRNTVSLSVPCAALDRARRGEDQDSATRAHLTQRLYPQMAAANSAAALTSFNVQRGGARAAMRQSRGAVGARTIPLAGVARRRLLALRCRAVLTDLQRPAELQRAVLERQLAEQKAFVATMGEKVVDQRLLRSTPQQRSELPAPTGLARKLTALPSQRRGGHLVGPASRSGCAGRFWRRGGWRHHRSLRPRSRGSLFRRRPGQRRLPLGHGQLRRQGDAVAGQRDRRVSGATRSVASS